MNLPQSLEQIYQPLYFFRWLMLFENRYYLPFHFDMENTVNEDSLTPTFENIKATLGELANSPDAVVVVDYDFTFLFVNEIAEKIYKRPKTELIGRHPSELFPKEWEFGPFKNIQKHVYERKRFDMNYHSPFANQWIQITGTPFKNYFTFVYKAVHQRTILDNELRKEVRRNK